MAADTRPLVPAALVLGVVAVLGGAVFVADGQGLLDAASAWALWPIGVVVVGLLMALQPGDDSRSLGLLVVVAGLWLLLNAIGVWAFPFWRAWPALLTVIGAWMLARTAQLRRRAGGAAGFDEARTGAARLGAFAFLAPVRRATAGQRLRAGDLVAIAGDGAFDLIDAARPDGTLVIDVLVVAGRLRLAVPDGWTVELRVLPLLARVDDRRGDDGGTGGAGRSAPGDARADRVDLRVRGTALGGVVAVVGAEALAG